MSALASKCEVFDFSRYVCYCCLVSATSRYPYFAETLAHLHVSLPRTDVASTTAWLYVANKDKRTANCFGGSLVQTCTTAFPNFYVYPFLVRTDMSVVFHPKRRLNKFTIFLKLCINATSIK
jgi:hypothetical protein